MQKTVYLDNNATTPLHSEVKQSITDAMEIFGNASSFHFFGREARELIENSRRIIASYINASPEEIIFLGSGSEANNTVLKTFGGHAPGCGLSTLKEKGIAVSRIEHPCILETAKCLPSQGTPVDYLEVDADGVISPEKLNAFLEKTPKALVSAMLANNEVGTLQDIRSLTEIVHKHGAFMHTDAVQAIGKVKVDVKELNIDFLSISAHKLYGPKGIGALYVKRGAPFCPFIHGGHQEKGRRAGTENTLGIVGFGKAVEIIQRNADEDHKRIISLRDYLFEGIKATIPDIKVNTPLNKSLPNTLNISFIGAEGESILLYLDLEGIAVSTGSACSSGSLDPSHVLLSMGLPAEEAHGSIRFSLGVQNTKEEIDYVLEKLPPIIERIRKMSTLY